MDVGFHPGSRRPDTVLATNFALISALSENKCLTKMLHLSYKAFLLVEVLTIYCKRAKEAKAANLKSIQLSLNKCFQDLKGDALKAQISNLYLDNFRC